MRRLAAAAVGAAALATTLFAAGPANAATGHQTSSAKGDGTGLSALATTATTPKRIGKIHKFTVASIKGAAGWGNWYWAKITGQPAFVVLNLNIKDTRADKKNAGLCYKLKSPVQKAWVNKCIVNTKGSGKTVTQHWTMGYWNQDKLEVQNTIGYLNAAKTIFYTTAEGKWLKLHWV